jgi:hypothetical protein
MRRAGRSEEAAAAAERSAELFDEKANVVAAARARRFAADVRPVTPAAGTR